MSILDTGRNEAANSRSWAPALERDAQEAPASCEYTGGRSLQSSVFRGWSLGTRTSLGRVEFMKSRRGVVG